MHGISNTSILNSRSAKNLLELTWNFTLVYSWVAEVGPKLHTKRELGKVRVPNKPHLRRFKCSWNTWSLTRMVAWLVLDWEMFLTSCDLPSLPSWINGVVSSQSTEYKPQYEFVLLANGKSMLPNFPQWKNGKFGWFHFPSTAEWTKRSEITKKTNRPKPSQNSQFSPKTKFTNKNLLLKWKQHVFLSS